MKIILVISLQIFLFAGLDCQLVFKDSPASATVLFNFPTTLRCTAQEPNPPANIVWLKDGVITETDPRGRFTINYNPTTGQSVYTINTVSYLDDGNYQCYAVNATGGLAASSSIGRLIVQGFPGFAHPLQPVIVPLGGSAVFDCPVLSNPLAVVSWTFQDGSPISSGSKHIIFPATTLTITDVQTVDEQFYVCTATNTFGRNSTSARLTIGSPPPELNPSITPSLPNPLVLNRGSILSLTCSVTPGSVFRSITWTRGSFQINNVAQTSNSLLLSIPSVDFEDGGVYTCSVVDNSGDTEDVSMRVEVHVPPQFTAVPQDVEVMENQQLSVTPVCSAVGEPDPTIAWFRADGTTIPLFNNIPQFGFLTRNDAGVYACVASNSAGVVRQEFSVTVQGPPRFTVPLTNEVEAFYGQDLVLQCVAEGPPEPVYEWTKDGSANLPDGTVISPDTTRLLLFSVTSTDEGMYQCTARNQFGQVSVQGQVTVSAQPRITQASVGTRYQAVGSSFTLRCGYVGPPSTVQVWTLNGVPLLPSQDPNLSLGLDRSLTVLNSQEQYSGDYVCNVTTRFSFDFAQTTVFIGSPPQFISSPSDTDLTPGSTATLSCVASGQPQPGSTWFKNNTSGARTELPTIGLTFTKLSTGLELRGVTRDDSGVYECVVDNGIGTARQSATVRVEGAPIVSGIRPPGLSIGRNATLECVADFTFPAGSVTWSRTDGTELSAPKFTVTDTGLLQIISVTTQDQGEYFCSVTNSYGTSSTTASISVFVAPTINFESTEVIAEVGGKFALECPASGIPTPTIGWLVNGQSLVEFPDFIFNSDTGLLQLNNPLVSNEGTLTCVATNSVGTASADVELLVRGPAVSSLSTGATTTNIIIISWTPPPPGALLSSYQIDYGIAGRQSGRLRRTASTSSRSSLISSLLPGTMYEFTIRGVFVGGLLGADRSILATTDETAPSGPPQNISVNPTSGGFSISWTLPRESERNGVIVSYRIFYRVTPDNATSDLPFTNFTYTRNQSEVSHFLLVSDLDEEIMYQVKLLASTAVGEGPESDLYPVTTGKRATFDPVDFPVVLNAVIGVGASVLGCLVLVAVILILFMLIRICIKVCPKVKEKYVRMKEERERQGKTKKKKVKSADAYNDPVDAVGGYSVPGPRKGQGSTGPVVRPEAGIYSEVQDKTGGPSQERDAAEESDSEQPAEPEVIVVSPPSPERRGPEGEDTGKDNAQLIYATVSEDYKQKKREKKSKEQQQLEAKQSKLEKKMQEKMDREKKKQEVKMRKQEEKERKRRMKEQQSRASLGLDNVVHLDNLSGPGSRTQAQFIDTAGLF